MTEEILLDGLDGFTVTEDEWGQVQCNQYGIEVEEEGYHEDVFYYGEEV